MTPKTTTEAPKAGKRNNRRTGEPRRVHNFRLHRAASDKLRQLAADHNTSQAAIIEHLLAVAT